MRADRSCVCEALPRRPTSIDAFDVDLQEWIRGTVKGEMNGPSAWDGYFDSVTADACVEAKHSGRIVPIAIDERPAFYDRSL